MITLFLALAAAAPTPPSVEAQFKDCLSVVKQAPDKAVAAANEWAFRGGGLYARQCLGLAYVALERWAPAATAYEQAAREAEKERDTRSGDLWVQSGNAWLAAGDGAKARAALDAALATTALSPELRGEVHLDRGRAAVQLGDLAGARADIDKGIALVPADPFGWYLSAALAVREKNLARASRDIEKALAIAPADADLLLQAGTIAGLSGDTDKARSLYERAAKASPASDAGRAAAAALAPQAAPQQPAATKPVEAARPK